MQHRRADIEGLRALAILLVVFYHTGVPGASGGFIGVDVFFVVSGYLITGLLVREFAATGRIRIFDFYARRVRRLLPASALVLLATLVAVLVVYSPFEQRQLARSALATSVYLSNIWFLRRSSDYFGPDVEFNPFLHTWSLAVEEQFYLVWPLIVVAALSRAGSRRRLAWTLGAVTALSLVACVYYTRVEQPAAFFGTHLRAWEFGAGGLVALLPVRVGQSHQLRYDFLAWGGLALILFAGTYLSEGIPFPGAAALLPVVGTAAMLFAGAHGLGFHLRAVMHSAPMQKIGAVSYSWYLWHWPALVVAAALFPEMTLPERATVSLIALGLAFASLYVIENPIRFDRYLVARPLVTLGLGLMVTLTVAGLAMLSGRFAVEFAESPQQATYARAIDERPLMDIEGCTVGFLESEPRECVYGDPAGETTVVLFGDSHASQWFPPLAGLAASNGWRIITLTKSACPAADVPVYSKELKRDFAECTAWRDAARRRILELHPDAVVIGNFSRRAPRDIGLDGEYVPLSYAEWEAGLEEVLTEFSGNGIPSLLMGDTPLARFEVPMCLSRAAHRRFRKPDCRIARATAIDQGTIEVEKNLASRIPGVTYLDFSARFCQVSVCEPVMDGFAVYRDGHHISVHMAQSLAPAIGDALSGLIER